MKFCPYCGATLIDGAGSFCSECGKPLKTADIAEKSVKKDNKKHTKRLKQKMQKENDANEDMQSVQNANPDEGYDGYYDDILPADEKIEQQGLDKTVIKNLIIIAVGVIIAISACVAAMYLM